MKKAIALILVLLMVFGMAACGSETDVKPVEGGAGDGKTAGGKGSGDPKAVAEAACDAFIAGEFTKMAELMHKDALAAEYSEEALREEDAYLKEEIEGYEVAYTIVSESSFADAVQSIQEWYGQYYNPDIKIGDAMEYVVDVSFTNDSGTNTVTYDVCVVEIDGAWYLDQYYTDLFAYLY